MPAHPRGTLDARNFPSRPGIVCLPNANNHERCNTNQKQGSDRGKLQGKARREKAPTTPHRLFCSNLFKRQRRLIVPVPPQQILQLLHFRVRLTRAVPQIIVFHGAVLLTHFCHSLCLPSRPVPSPASPSPPIFPAAFACR